MNGLHALGHFLNEAVRIAPSSVPTEPKSGHETFADMFWESLSVRNGRHDVVDELNRIMNYLLTQSRRDARTERGLWFVSFVFGRMLDATDVAKRSAANAFLHTLCDRSSCENKTIRFRCVQCIRMALESLAAQPEIDEAVAEMIFATLLARIRDRSYDVRTQSLLALDRFKVPGDNGQYENDQVMAAYFISLQKDPHPNPRAAILDCLPIIPASIEAICAQTGDVSDVVRIHALKVILTKLTPEIMGAKWCGEVMRNGLRDRSDLVRCLAEQTLLSWFDDAAAGNPVVFFAFLDEELHGELFTDVMDILLTQRVDALLSWSETAYINTTTIGCLTSNAYFWRTLFCGCKQRGEMLGRDAASNAKKAAEAQKLFDLLERLLPPSLVDIIQPLEDLMEQQRWMPCHHLLQILTHCFNFTDEGDQRIAAALYQKFCGWWTSEMVMTWYATLTAFGRRVWPDPFDFVQNTIAVLEDRSTFFASDGLFRHWIFLAVEMLRSLPYKTRNALALGTSTFTVADILKVFKERLTASPDALGLEKELIEGIGICLTFRLTHEEHESCIPLIWRAFESSEDAKASAAAFALTTLAMVYGVRRMDLKPLSTVPDAPFAPLWTCQIFDQTSETASLPIRFMSALHWEQTLPPAMQRALVQSLCKLLMMNNAYGKHGMSIGECIQCLCPLVVIFVYEEDDEEQNAQFQQLLKVFFDRYAQAGLQHQYLFRAGFVPILRYCLEVTEALRLSIASTTKFLANLLLAPIRSNHASTVDREEARKELARMNCELTCLLLWEMRQCPTELSSSKAYVTSLFKAISDLDIEASDEMNRLNVLNLLTDSGIKKALTAKQRETLKAKLNVPERLEPLQGEEWERSKQEIATFIEQLGAYPFSEEEDDDD